MYHSILFVVLGLSIGFLSGFVVNGLQRIEMTTAMGPVAAAVLLAIRSVVIKPEDWRGDATELNTDLNRDSSTLSGAPNPYQSPSRTTSNPLDSSQRSGFRYLVAGFVLVVLMTSLTYYLMTERVPNILKHNDESGLATSLSLQHAMAASDRATKLWPIVLGAFAAPLLIAERYTKGSVKKRARIAFSFLTSVLAVCFAAWMWWAVASATT